MLANVVERVMAYLEKHEMIPDDEREVYAYSLEVTLASAVFWLMMIALTLLFGQVGPTIVYLGVFFFVRSAIGGYHASTHLRCSAVSAAAYLVFIWCYGQFSTNVVWSILLSSAAVVLIALFAPVDHPNKPFSDTERVHYRRQSCRRAVIILILQITLVTSGQTAIAFCTACGITQAAAFMLVAYLIQKGGELDGNAIC